MGICSVSVTVDNPNFGLLILTVKFLLLLNPSYGCNCNPNLNGNYLPIETNPRGLIFVAKTIAIVIRSIFLKLHEIIATTRKFHGN
jgi:hypothetical protein